MGIPSKFLWGGSISAAQVEGGWNEGGKSPVQIDYAAAAKTTEPRLIHFRNADGTRGTMRQFLTCSCSLSASHIYTRSQLTVVLKVVKPISPKRRISSSQWW